MDQGRPSHSGSAKESRKKNTEDPKRGKGESLSGDLILVFPFPFTAPGRRNTLLDPRH